MKQKAEIKYEQILYRDFENTMEMFIYSKNFPTFSKDDLITLTEFKKFIDKKDSTITLEYIKENQNSKLAAQLDIKYMKYYKLYLKENNEYYKEFDKYYRGTFTYKEFSKKYGKDEDNRKCEYCGITEYHIKSLLEKGYIKSKSLWNRGKFMEIDRKNPLKGYSFTNIALCCYWCNNAKTDEFNFEEFKIIRIGFTSVWNERIAKFNSKEYSPKLPGIWSIIETK